MQLFLIHILSQYIQKLSLRHIVNILKHIHKNILRFFLVYFIFSVHLNLGSKFVSEIIYLYFKCITFTVEKVNLQPQVIPHILTKFLVNFTIKLNLVRFILNFKIEFISDTSDISSAHEAHLLLYLWVSTHRSTSHWRSNLNICWLLIYQQKFYKR